MTDFYCQGMSFKDDCWLAHLNPPATGQSEAGKRTKLRRANVFVTLTRYASLDRVQLVAPLWPEGDAAARLNVINQFKEACRMSVDLTNEIDRLQRAADETKQRYPDLWRQAQQYTGQLPQEEAPAQTQPAAN